MRSKILLLSSQNFLFSLILVIFFNFFFKFLAENPNTTNDIRTLRIFGHKKSIRTQRIRTLWVSNTTRDCCSAGAPYLKMYKLHLTRDFDVDLDAIDCHLKWLNYCQRCSMTFSTRNCLKKHHVRVHSENAPKPFLCSICGKTYTTRGNLNKHHKQNHIHENLPLTN